MRTTNSQPALGIPQVELDMLTYASFTDRRDSIIVTAYLEGYGSRAIESIMGVGRATIYRVLRNAGVEIGDDS